MQHHLSIVYQSSIITLSIKHPLLVKHNHIGGIHPSNIDTKQTPHMLLLTSLFCPCEEGLSSSGAMVGAITNGMGNPTEIPILSEFFHFCVSAEEEPGVMSREEILAILCMPLTNFSSLYVIINLEPYLENISYISICLHLRVTKKEAHISSLQLQVWMSTFCWFRSRFGRMVKPYIYIWKFFHFWVGF